MSMVLSLDVEMELDRVEWPYLLFVLKIFGLGDYFFNWIKVLYNSPQAAVITNGLRSKTFPLQWENCQGDPLSPLLFNLAVEPLA